MKKKNIFALMIVGMLSLTACGNTNSNLLNPDAKIYTVSDEWKKNTVKEIAGQLNSLVNDEQYIDMIGNMFEDDLETLKNATIDTSKSFKAYTYTENVVQKIITTSGIKYNDLSDVAKRKIDKADITMLINPVLSMLGTKTLVAYSSFQIFENYAIDQTFDKQIWIIPTTSNDVKIIAALNSSDEIYPMCSVSCSYLINTSEKDTDDYINQSFTSYGINVAEMNFD